MRQIDIIDQFNTNKIHSFRLYSDHHVTYNQMGIDRNGNVHKFYRAYTRVNMKFGYCFYLEQAKKLIRG